MSTKFQIRNGNQMGNESLCNTCRYARIITGFSESEQLVFCDHFYPTKQLLFRVRECSEYNDKRLPYHEDLEKIAWILVSKSAGKTAGFMTAKQFREMEEDDEE